jgi:hypothetical protein
MWLVVIFAYCFTLCFALAKALTLMLCSLGFAVSNVEDFDNMSRYLQLVGISRYY